MLAITATNSTTPSPQAALAKARVAQADRDASQAEKHAQDLRSQADTAELEAQQRQSNARALAARNSNDSSANDVTYASPRKPNPSEVPQRTQDFLVSMYGASSEKFAASGNPLKTDVNALPVRNSQGQSTGRIVNLSA
jgi:hypothetical protein